MRFSYMVERAVRDGGFASDAEAARALVATAEFLGFALLEIDAPIVADNLPAELGEPIRRGRHGHDTSPDELYRHVARQTGAPSGRAREQAQVACREIAQNLSGEARSHLVMNVPHELAELFATDRDWPDPPVRPHPREQRTRPIAEARAGSRHPLSESRPRGQTHSVAESDRPHDESKLSTGRTSAEDEGETVSRGRRGSRRPLADADD